MSDFVAVIIAGGSGQRFWPLSTTTRPKQFLDLERCGRSLLQATFDRLEKLLRGPEHIFIVTGKRYADLVLLQLPALRPENLLLEPVGRDTAPAIALATLEIRSRLGNPILGIFPSDHRIADIPAFYETVQRAVALTEASNGIVTLGIKPDRPATGYGYIEQGDALADGYKVARFVEKPNLESAQNYLESGRYSWNGGIFFWRVQTILDELSRYAPGLLTPLEEAHKDGQICAIFPDLPKLSIDYAVMERTQRAYVVPADIGWDDVGDWQALERLLQKQQDSNTVIGQHVGLETSGNIIYTENEEDIVVTLGVNNLIIVKRQDTVLLMQKDQTQDLKKLLADDRLLDFFPEQRV